MYENKIIVTKPSTIKAPDKKKLAKAGYIIIETDNPQDVILPVGNGIVSNQDLFMAAMAGAYDGFCSREKMVKELVKRLTEKEIKKSI